MGGEISCVCSGAQNEKDLNQCISVENRQTKRFKENSNMEDFFDVKNNRKITLIDTANFEMYIKSAKNYVVPSKKSLKTTEVNYFLIQVTTYYNSIFPVNYLARRNMLLVIMEHNSKIGDGMSFRRNVRINYN
jgi:hypothetical protein